MFNLPLPVVILLEPRLPDLCFLYSIITVITGKNRHLTAIQLYHFLYHFVQEITVMADNYHRSFVIEQKCFQPGNGTDIQMIGRLVKENHIRLRHQKLAQADPGALPPGQFFHMLCKLLLCKSQTFEDAYNFAFIRIAALPFKFQIQTVITVHKVFQLTAV